MRRGRSGRTGRVGQDGGMPAPFAPGPSSPDRSCPEPEGSSVPAVDAGEALRHAEAGAFLLDVREVDEWEAGHALAATWIPMGDVTARISELPGDAPIA